MRAKMIFAPIGKAWRWAAFIATCGVGSVLVAHFFRPEPTVTPPPDPDLQRQLTALNAATPERLTSAQRDFTALVAGLEPARNFESRLKAWGSTWNMQRRAADSIGPVEIRSYILSLRDPKLDAWPEIDATLQSLCSIPGVTVERAVLAVATDGEKFDRAEIEFTARLSL